MTRAGWNGYWKADDLDRLIKRYERGEELKPLERRLVEKWYRYRDYPGVLGLEKRANQIVAAGA